jgi:hypothetical protein
MLLLQEPSSGTSWCMATYVTVHKILTWGQLHNQRPRRLVNRVGAGSAAPEHVGGSTGAAIDVEG